MALDEARHPHVLREDQNARSLGEDGVEQLVQQLQLPDLPGIFGRSSLRNCAGWLQICFSPVSSFTIRPRRAMLSAPEISARVSRATTCIEARLLLGERDGTIGLGLGGSSGAIPGSDLRRRSRNGRTNRVSRSAAAGS